MLHLQVWMCTRFLEMLFFLVGNWTVNNFWNPSAATVDSQGACSVDMLDLPLWAHACVYLRADNESLTHWCRIGWVTQSNFMTKLPWKDWDPLIPCQLYLWVCIFLSSHYVLGIYRWKKLMILLLFSLFFFVHVCVFMFIQMYTSSLYVCVWYTDQYSIVFYYLIIDQCWVSVLTIIYYKKEVSPMRVERYTNLCR